MTTESRSLAEALPLEIERVKELIKLYEDPMLKGAGDLACALMKMDIDKAEKATQEQDTVAMLRAYQELKTYEV